VKASHSCDERAHCGVSRYLFRRDFSSRVRRRRYRDVFLSSSFFLYPNQEVETINPEPEHFRVWRAVRDLPIALTSAAAVLSVYGRNVQEPRSGNTVDAQDTVPSLREEPAAR
jgi:hypothetical protein